MPDLSRFHAVDAQTHESALAGIRQGEKRSPWMWFENPQLRDLGTSATATHFGLMPDEAGACLADHILGPRPGAVSRVLMDHAGRRRAVKRIWHRLG